MEQRHVRNLPALTEEECALLRDRHVAVIGCGGLGGFIIEALSRIGIGALTVVDGDVFEESNLNRQLLSTCSALGKSKAEAAAERIHAIDPAIRVTCVPRFLTEENADEILDSCDVVVDALDNVPARLILSAACRRTRIPYVYGGISGWVAQAAVSLPSDHLIEALFSGKPALSDKSALSFTPMLCAAVQTSLCIRLLCGRKVESGCIYYFDLLSMETQQIPLCGRPV